MFGFLKRKKKIKDRPAEEQTNEPLLSAALRAETNETLIQYFEWYLPDDGLLWKKAAANAERLASLGVTGIWLPPAYKGTSSNDVGYGVYDLYDLGEFDQNGTVRTKYGTREDYLAAVRALQSHGIKVLADIVLNQKMAADGAEDAEAFEVDPGNRLKDISEKEKIRAWTRFTFPGRHGMYSDFTWNHEHFTGVDFDMNTGKNGIFRFSDKEWNPETDTENGNFDYLMGADVDVRNPEVVRELDRWGRWYYDTVHMDGFRLDALKHISWGFMADWLGKMRAYAGRPLIAVGEMWCPELDKILAYADHTGHTMQLFDAPLHYKFMSASQMWDRFPMRYLFNDTLVEKLPDEAVTVVDNHDTEPGQSLASYVEGWFKPIAYALILLRKAGTPCVFYGDLYGIPSRKTGPCAELSALMLIRKLYAYGNETDYFDDDHLIGWTLSGDDVHPDSGLAVVLTNGNGGKKHMAIGRNFAGHVFRDALGFCQDAVPIGEDGSADFSAASGSASVWLDQAAYEKIRTSF